MKLNELIDKTYSALTYIPQVFSAEDAEAIYTQLKDIPNFPHFAIDNGVTKAVVIIKECDNVIKIPFTHFFNDEQYSEDCIYADNENHSEPDPEDYLYEIDGASDVKLPMETDWDYCELECEIYHEANSRGLGKYFAEEDYLFSINNHPVYRQLRCVPFESISIDYSTNDYQKLSENTYNRCQALNCDCFNPYWINDFFSWYGEEEFIKLTAFLKEFNINDLRDSNIGYRNGAPILFDYSGFHGSF